MEPITANISIKTNTGENKIKATKVRFSANCCLAYDNGAEDRRCLQLVGDYLMSKDSGLAFYGYNKLCTYFFEHVPELRNHVNFIIEDDTSKHGIDTNGIKVISLNELPQDINTVFLCETLTIKLMQMRKNISKDLLSVTLDILKDFDWQVIPLRAWIPDYDTIYPIDIPDFRFLPDQDLILIDCPSRNMSLMPNGLAYVHNALKKIGIEYQTVDLDIVLYHRYHTYRLFDTNGEIFTSDGHRMLDDPWMVEHYEEWQNPEFIEFFRPEIDEIIRELTKARPKILALSIQACNINFSREVVNGVKKNLPDTIILVGGYSCFQPSIGIRAFPECDYMVIGEGDLSVGPLVERLLSGERPVGTHGIHSRYDPEGYISKPGVLPHDLDIFEMPKYDWFDNLNIYRNYNHYWLTPIIASRGCRWSRCNFCAERFSWRARLPKKVVDEIEWLVNQGCDLFVFNESDLNGKPEYLLEICDEVIRRKLKVRLSGQLRIHKGSNLDFFMRLRTAGFVALRFGIDAWTKNTLRLQMKGYTVNMISQNLRDCHKAGIYSEVNTVIGVPGETDDDIKETIERTIENKEYIGRIASINPLVLLLGSIYWNEPEKYNIHFRQDKEELFKKYPSAIPSDLWYSTDPYIDEKVRNERFNMINMELYKNGFELSAFAAKVVKDMEEGKGAEGSARPDAEGIQHVSDKEEKIEKVESESDVTQEHAESEDKISYVFKYSGEFYGIGNDEKINLDALDGNVDVKRMGPVQTAVSIIKEKSLNMLHNPERIRFYARKAINIIKVFGIRDLMRQVFVRIKDVSKKDYLVIEPGKFANVEKNIPIQQHMINDGFHGYNIIKAGSDFYGIKHGYPFNKGSVDDDEHEAGIYFKSNNIKGIENLIEDFIMVSEAQK
ncbi:MAG: radical SAM protein [Candidatus Scalindua sp.]|jgi:radical SAM superfamily enzyme YgiQ (UPF0313 family)|nr:radical SAM protein [Candidatus Scalindua sp.]